MRALPAVLATADPRVVRPRDAADAYVQPAKELGALAIAGILFKLAHGYYALVPERDRYRTGWRPTIEGVALGIAQVDYPFDDVALMGISAARMLGAVPRALGTAVVAIPVQRRAMSTSAGDIVFVKRRVSDLATRSAGTDLATGWCTDIEQTLLDLEDRPRLGDLDPAAITEAKAHLSAKADRQRVAALGARLRKRSAAERVLTAMDE